VEVINTVTDFYVNIMKKTLFFLLQT